VHTPPGQFTWQVEPSSVHIETQPPPGHSTLHVAPAEQPATQPPKVSSITPHSTSQIAFSAHPTLQLPSGQSTTQSEPASQLTMQCPPGHEMLHVAPAAHVHGVSAVQSLALASLRRGPVSARAPSVIGAGASSIASTPEDDPASIPLPASLRPASMAGGVPPSSSPQPAIAAGARSKHEAINHRLRVDDMGAV